MTYKSRKSASQQLTGLGFVVILHIIAIYAVASGLAHKAVETVMGPIETKIIEEAKPKSEDLPPPPPKLQTPPPYVPPPDLDVAIDAPPPAANTTAIAAVQTTQKVVAPPPPPAAADVAPRFDPKAARANAFPDSEYPDQSRRLNEEGDVIISLLVGTDGKVTDGKIEKSSGFDRLDKAALDYYLRRGRFLPGIKDGQPIAAWKSIKVTFKLKK